MSMSVSILSEASKDEIETDDKELQELVWNLMSRSGLLSEMQGRISKFLEENGKDDKIHVIPDRADAKLLGLIFEYLQWVGMKQTNSVLLSESPVEVDLSVYEARSKDTDYKPKLCRLLEEGADADGNGDGTDADEEEEDRMTPSKSQNYSKDEFDDSKCTSFSGHPSVNKVNDEEEVEDLASDNEEEEEEEEKSHESDLKKSPDSSHSSSKHKETEDSGKNNDALNANANADGTEIDKPSEQPIFNPVITTTGGHVDMTEGRDRDDMLIDFNSPIKPKGMDQARPHVTVRQRMDLGGMTSDDSFQTPGSFGMDRNLNFSIPVAQSSNTFDFNAPSSNPNDELIPPPPAPPPTANSKPDEDNNFFEVVNETEKSEKVEPKNTNLFKQVPQGQESPEDDSTSDFMETLTMEEDTQDVSIPSDTKGMSSCEHAVNFK